MIDARFKRFVPWADAMYLSAWGDGYTVANMLDGHVDLEVVPKRGFGKSFVAAGADLDAMLDDAWATLTATRGCDGCDGVTPNRRFRWNNGDLVRMCDACIRTARMTGDIP